MDTSGFPWCSVLYSDDEDHTTATPQGLYDIFVTVSSLCFVFYMSVILVG